MKKIVCLLSMLLLSTCSIAATLDRALNYVALSGMAMPGYGDRTFAHFSVPHLNINHVVFSGQDKLGLSGIYSNLLGSIQVVANQNMIAPTTRNKFNNFTNIAAFLSPKMIPHNMAIYGDTIAFIGASSSYQSGVYAYSPNTGLAMIANNSSSLPNNQGTFSSFTLPSVLSDGSIAFWGQSSSGAQGIYTYNDNTGIQSLADNSTVIPQGQGTFHSFLYMDFSKSTKNPKSFAFIGTGNNKQMGLYYAHDNTIDLFANNKTKLPGNNVGNFTGFKALSLDGVTGRVAFIGDGILGQESLFLAKAKHLVSVVSQQDLIPSGVGHFQHFSHPTLRGNNIVFAATGPFNQEGVFLYNTSGNIYKVISNKDKINNKTIKSVNFSDDAFSYNRVAVKIVFTDKSEGIYLITIGSSLKL